MKIKDIFAKPIDRNIKGVITIGDEQDANVKQELEEYVVTHELQKHFHDFFKAYVASINHDTSEMGVWISGFFGSGKSHFLKILAYMLENRNVAGKPAIDYFLDDNKIRSQETVDAIQLATSVHNETILFNIDSKAKNGSKSQKDAILNVFWQVFNEKIGLIGVDFWIADMERNLINDDKYEAFQAKFQELDDKGRTWQKARNGFAFFKNTIKEALVAVGEMTEENADGFIEQLKTEYPLSVEDFAQRVNEYIEQQADPDYHLVFLVDEIGQYIGDSQQRMLNLQSVVEDLGTYTHGKAWVIVTSQQAIDQVTDHINGQDFSKIQGRFNTRIAMSSANVDEVINKRLLVKTPESERSLMQTYSDDQHAINNLMTFESDITRDHYQSAENFADVYPFVPYQYNLLQDTLTAIRENGSDGKHLANGERSMLAVFQESAQRIENEDVRALVPFSIFFQGLDQFLDHTHMIVIQRAIKNERVNPDGVEHPFAVQVLETLFMVKYVDNFNATLNNVVTLMIDSIDTDRVELEKRVKEALIELTNQNFIEETTKGFEFLTNAEQEISRSISKQDVEPGEVSREIGNYLFGAKKIERKFTYPKLNKQYTFNFNQFVDDQPLGLANNTLSLKLNTPESNTNRDETELRRIALSPSEPQIIIDMPRRDDYTHNLSQALKIQKFVMDPGAYAKDARSNNIIDVKRAERVSLIEKVHVDLEDALEDADIYVGGELLEAGSKSFGQRLNTAQEHLVDEIYRNLSYITAVKSEKDIVALFNQELITPDENKQAVEAVMNRIVQDADNGSHGKVAYKSILDRFGVEPYGYRDIDIKWMVAKLFADNRIKVYVNNALINMEDTTKPVELANYFVKKQYVDKMQFVPRVAVSEEKRQALKAVAKDVFNRQSFDDDEDDTLVNNLRQSMIKERDALNEFVRLSTRYPGRNVLENGLQLMNSLISQTDTDQFYDKLFKHQDDFLDWSDDMYDYGLIDFYNNPTQEKIWKDALSKIDIYEKSSSFISGAEVGKIYKQIKDRVDANKADRLNELNSLNEEFNSAYSAEFDKTEADIKANVNIEWQAALNYAKNKDLIGQFETTINQAFEQFIQEAQAARNLDELVVIKSKASVKKDNLQTRIDEEIVEIEKKQAALQRAQKQVDKDETNTDEDQTPTATSITVTPQVPTTKHVSLKNLPVNRSWQVTSAKEVDEQLAQLRKVLIAQLDNVDELKIDL
ncbi:BREX system P-loop protein BrxC [Lactiplantibacillus plantarum]|uniref:BREX system P-loop protein BrxC n=1 Tax=Lactiplantibacillus plantarum TaxID=1590 RepID=UPI00156F89C5|nr:BREX system P-loop protein BrxC [Lactiplantibacillus plantarum]MBS0953896.1 BREX system P-loop protein BrxC [Lactiplantibacillus plantarum]MBY7658679.1 BREX system P-loop protein BrxC [Lactiplantibacillus plantarum]MCT3232450.1 BREX system P-loop protein BrxC [Lactiplantibacillus plantarum]MCT3550893.1 BREX system P-loop protein BrxC [Lactiplantibacillus plantarum]QKK60189.1 BREX system P-loop protein BrxC [Lactiplantibacillus plantarum]